jgi:hypothetical protein
MKKSGKIISPPKSAGSIEAPLRTATGSETVDESVTSRVDTR